MVLISGRPLVLVSFKLMPKLNLMPKLMPQPQPQPKPKPLRTLMRTLTFTFTFMLMLMLVPVIARGEQVHLTDLGDFEVYSAPGSGKKANGAKPLLEETSRNAMNNDGLLGYFVSETADKLAAGQMFAGARFEFHDLTSRRGTAYRVEDKGSVSSLLLSVNYIGEWAEWAVTIPMHRWDLSAPRTYNRMADSNEGIGNLRLGWKATYLPDRSYYRFAYGAVANVTTGNPETMLPAGSRREDELKLYGCVTTRETDWAVANLELGAIVNSGNHDDRFIFGLSMSYEASRHATLIGELVGEIQGGNDQDTMDLIAGIRLAPTRQSVLEFAYTKNLRTFREYGFDDRLQIGTTIRW